MCIEVEKLIPENSIFFLLFGRHAKKILWLEAYYFGILNAFYVT
ncbi:hypothetical protein D1BOALGB6SA_1972 [Olavius sp. associated proteobacterium Delta 1]|nr:hypothetical protein D1BOALGB6SA_1972 [Olavius sp. associated proteobacterium Delta 1]